MRNIFKFNLLLLCLYSHLSWAHQYEFNDLVVFGDSLSDVGNLSRNDTNKSKFIFHPNENKLYIEYLAEFFTGKQIKASVEGGTDFAVANSTTNLVKDGLSYQIANYLENNQHLNKNDLYIVYSGGNDFNNYINISINLFGENSLFFFNFPLTPQLTASNVSSAVNSLVNADANYVITPNLFEINMTPLFNFIPFYAPKILLNNFLGIAIFPVTIAVFDIVYLAQTKFIENIFRNKKDYVPNEVTGSKYIKTLMSNYYKHIPFGDKIYNFIYDLFQSYNDEYNFLLVDNLQKINGNIVFMDIHQLFNEIIDNPTKYGLEYLIMPQCNIVNTLDYAEKCYYSDEYNNQGNYLWSDQVHPSPFIHMLYAQYMTSVFNAPVLVSSITSQLAYINDNNQDYIFNHLITSNPKNNINQLLAFTSISGLIYKIGAPYDYSSKKANTHSLNIGVTYGLNSKLIIGTMLSSSYGSIKPYDNFRYKHNSQILNIFSKYAVNDNWWLNTDLNLGKITADDIRRTIPLGAGKHIEQSNTSGTSVGIDFTFGYDLKYKDNITLTTYTNLNLNNYKINAFSEKDNNSTSMRYDKSSTTNKSIQLGLRATDHQDTKIKFIQLGFIQPLHNQAIKIKSGLKSTTISFIREINANKKPSLNLAVGFNKKLNRNLFINASINYKINKYKNQQLNYDLGLNWKF